MSIHMIMLKERFIDLPELHGQMQYRLMLNEDTTCFAIHTILTLWHVETINSIDSVGFNIDVALSKFNVLIGVK